MHGVLEGFATIGTIIVLGLVLAHVGVLGKETQVLLSRVAFFVASPALMVTVLSRTDVTEVLSRSLVASAVGVVVTGSCYLVVARLRWRKNVGDSVIGVLSAVYVNAGNLGLPIAAYVLGDVALVAPVLLMQLLVLQPLALATLDTTVSGKGFSLPRSIARGLANPLTLGSLVGLALAITHRDMPAEVHQPLVLLGGMAVPAMLLAYGVSLRFGPLPGTGISAPEVGFITMLKMVLQPVTVYLVARLALGLGGHALFAVTVLAALPTAQNIFVHATRYGRAVVVARDSIFLTTVLSVPAIFVITVLLT